MPRHYELTDEEFALVKYFREIRRAARKELEKQDTEAVKNKYRLDKAPISESYTLPDGTVLPPYSWISKSE